MTSNTERISLRIACQCQNKNEEKLKNDFKLPFVILVAVFLPNAMAAVDALRSGNARVTPKRQRVKRFIEDKLGGECVMRILILLQDSKMDSFLRCKVPQCWKKSNKQVISSNAVVRKHLGHSWAATRPFFMQSKLLDW